MKRDYAIDHLRCGVVLLVVIYHIFYLFNSIGVISSIDVQGIPCMDVIEYILYPWFMAVLFLLAGISARYSLSHRTLKEFWAERRQRILVPAIGSLFLTCWITGLILRQYVDVFGGQGSSIPVVIRYLLFCVMGTGPTWFLHVILVVSLVLTLVYKLDRSDRLYTLGAKAASPLVLLLFFFPYWGASQILNIPIMPMYRFGVFTLLFLLGYCVFSHAEVLDVLKKWHLPLLAAAVAAGIAFVVCFWGKPYGELPCLKHPLTSAYAWLAILALLGCARAWWGRESAFTRYLRPRSFAIYVLHYPVLSVFAWLYATVLGLPVGLVYFLLIVTMVITMPLLYEGISRIPGLRFWLLGIRGAKKSHAAPAATAAPAEKALPRLHVSGTRLVDENGTPVRLHGISTHGLTMYPEYVTLDSFRSLRDSWGINVIRLALYTAEPGGYCEDGDKARLKQLVRSGVDYAAQLGLYVIIDWHILSDYSPAMHEEEAAAFFAEMSAYCRGRTNVLYEICNEPQQSPWHTVIKPYAEKILAVIRANDPDAPVLVGTNSWSQDVQEVPGDMLADPNVLYVLHFYAGTHKDALRRRLADALDAGLPVFISECSICAADGSGGIDYESAEAWLALIRERGLSYVEWNLSNKAETSAILKPACTKLSGWTDADLTDTALWFKKAFHTV